MLGFYIKGDSNLRTLSDYIKNYSCTKTNPQIPLLILSYPINSYFLPVPPPVIFQLLKNICSTWKLSQTLPSAVKQVTTRIKGYVHLPHGAKHFSASYYQEWLWKRQRNLQQCRGTFRFNDGCSLLWE